MQVWTTIKRTTIVFMAGIGTLIDIDLLLDDTNYELKNVLKVWTKKVRYNYVHLIV